METCCVNIILNNTGDIYVPNASLVSYKAAQYWSTYADIIYGF